MVVSGGFEPPTSTMSTWRSTTKLTDYKSPIKKANSKNTENNKCLSSFEQKTPPQIKVKFNFIKILQCLISIRLFCSDKLLLLKNL